MNTETRNQLKDGRIRNDAFTLYQKVMISVVKDGRNSSAICKKIAMECYSATVIGMDTIDKCGRGDA